LVVAQIAVLQNDYDNRDVTGISNFYTSTSVVYWYGETNGLGGIQMGKGNIQLLYAASLGSTTVFQINFTDIQTKAVSANVVNATSVAVATGHSNVVGNMNASVNVSQEWVLSGTTWSIQKEDWNYTLFNVQNPSDATVFPQWGLSLSGQNPNLADMHVIEWNYAPYVAAAIYVALAGIAVAALWIRRTQRV
jgi:hypothetical protein